jgi:hypothetical protein
MRQALVVMASCIHRRRGCLIAEEVLYCLAAVFDIDSLRIERYATGTSFERNII